MTSSDKTITITKYILGLVDDARQYSNDWYNNDLNEIIGNLPDGEKAHFKTKVAYLSISNFLPDVGNLFLSL